MIRLIKILSILLIFPFSGWAIDEYEIIIMDHKFIPDQLELPANQKIKLVIHNQDNEPEEFESFDLRREKIVPAQSTIKLNIGPLKPGKYKFFGDFHNKTAQGIIIVN